MSQSIRIMGLDALTGRMRTWPQQISHEVLEQVMVEARPLLGHMQAKAGAVGGSSRKAARGLTLGKTRDGVGITARASDVLMGAEFGSKRGGPKRSYATRSRTGNAYIVRRRTKAQFRPFLGTRGYWFWPTVRTDLRGINERVGAVIAKAVQ